MKHYFGWVNAYGLLIFMLQPAGAVDPDPGPTVEPSRSPIQYQENRLDVTGRATRINTRSVTESEIPSSIAPGGGGIVLGEDPPAPAPGTPGTMTAKTITDQVLDREAVGLQNRRYIYRLPAGRGRIQERTLTVGASLSHAQMAEFWKNSVGSFSSIGFGPKDELYKTSALNVSGSGAVVPGYRFNDGATFIYVQGGAKGAMNYALTLPLSKAPEGGDVPSPAGEGSWVYVGIAGGGGVGREIGKGALLVGPVAETGVRIGGPNGGALRESSVGARAKYVAPNVNAEAVVTKGSETSVLSAPLDPQTRAAKTWAVGAQVSVRLTPRIGAGGFMKYQKVVDRESRTDGGVGSMSSVSNQSAKTLVIGVEGGMNLGPRTDRPKKYRKTRSAD